MFRLAALSILNSCRISQVCASLLSSPPRRSAILLRTRVSPVSPPGMSTESTQSSGILCLILSAISNSCWLTGSKPSARGHQARATSGLATARSTLPGQPRCQCGKFAIQASLPDAKHQRACNANRGDPEFWWRHLPTTPLDELSHLVALRLLDACTMPMFALAMVSAAINPANVPSKADPYIDDVTQGGQTRGVSAHLVIQNVDRWPKSPPDYAEQTGSDGSGHPEGGLPQIPQGILDWDAASLSRDVSGSFLHASVVVIRASVSRFNSRSR